MADVSPSVAACMSDMAAEILELRARLAAVEALCMRSEWGDWPFAKKVLAVARGEGDDAR